MAEGKQRKLFRQQWICFSGDQKAALAPALKEPPIYRDKTTLAPTDKTDCKVLANMRAHMHARMHTCTHACTEAQGSSLQGASAKPNVLSLPYPHVPDRAPVRRDEHHHSAELPQPRAGTSLLASKGSRGKPWHRAGHTEWAHAREQSAPAAEMKYYRVNVLCEGGGESPEESDVGTTICY